MPIVDLQRRMRELGRIRLGVKNAKNQPISIGTFRLTSSSSDLLDAAAELYGGKVELWPDAPQAGRVYQLTTDTDSLPVAIPPGQSLSQWYEQWSGGGCTRRCDGVRETIQDQPCICALSMKSDDDERDCKPTTRLSVFLPELWDMGVWRLETHGWYAAVELGGIVPFLEAATARNVALPAKLRIEHRTVIRTGQPKRQFPVPIIEVGTKLDVLLQAVGMLETPTGPAETGRPLAAGAAPALEGGQHTRPALPAKDDPSEHAGAATAPPAPKPAPTATATAAPAKQIAARMLELGLDEPHQRAFASWYFERTVGDFATDLQLEEIQEMHALLTEVDTGVSQIVIKSGYAWLEDTAVDTPDSAAVEGTHTLDEWKAKLEQTTGVGPATLIKLARDTAGKMDLDSNTISSLAALSEAPVQLQTAVWSAMDKL